MIQLEPYRGSNRYVRLYGFGGKNWLPTFFLFLVLIEPSLPYLGKACDCAREEVAYLLHEEWTLQYGWRKSEQRILHRECYEGCA